MARRRLQKPPAADPRDWRDLIWIYNHLDAVAAQCEHYVTNGASFGEDHRSFFIHYDLERMVERAARWRLRVDKRGSFQRSRVEGQTQTKPTPTKKE